MTQDTADPHVAPTRPISRERQFLAAGALLGNRFQVVKLAGAGGMGEVYKAWDTLLERFVALKSVRAPEGDSSVHVERFRQEAQTLAHLNHPGICQAYDLVHTELGNFLAMEWVEGRTLDQATRGISSKDKLWVLLEVAEALTAAHLKGMVHRDMKPLNIMIDGDGHVKILDFGLARLITADEEAPVSRTERLFRTNPIAAGLPVDDADLPTGFCTALAERVSHRSEHITRLGFFMGSPRYASPEQIRGELASTPSDVFSFGVVMWELLLGEHPFPGEGKDRLHAVVSGRRKKIRGHLPRRLSRLLCAMLSLHPQDRPTAQTVAKTLHRHLHPHKVVKWAIFSATATLLASSLAYFVMARGIISDLTRVRPARLVILPTLNNTGDPSLTARLKWGVPEILGSSLRGSPKLSVVPHETLNRAISDLGFPRNATLGPQDIERLEKYLGADLYLFCDMAKNSDGQGMVFNYRLLDKSGKTRLKGSETESRAEPSMDQTLPRAASTKLMHAVDPLGRDRTQNLPHVLPPEVLTAYSEGMDLMDKGQFKEAAPSLQRAAKGAPWFSRAIVNLGICLNFAGDPTTEMAIQWGRWSARASGNPRDELTALTVLGLLQQDQGRWEEARTTLEEALRLSESTGAEDQAPGILNNLSIVLMETHHPQEAEQHLQRALELDRRLGLRAEEATTLNLLAGLAKERGDFGTARHNNLIVLGLGQQLGDRSKESMALNNLGDIAIATGQFQEAQERFRESLKLKRLIGDRRGEFFPLANLGILARIQKNWGQGTAHLEEALSLSRELGRPPLEAIALFQLAELSRVRGETPKALSRYQEASRIHQKLGDIPSLTQDLAGQAECLMILSPRSTKGEAILKEAGAQEQNNPFVLRSQAKLELLSRRKGKAREFLERAIEAAKKTAPEEVPELREILARAS